MLRRQIIKILVQITKKTERRNGSHVAFIGIGIMGSHMSRHLISKGETVKVFDLIPSAAKNVKGAAQVCSSAEEAAKGASVIITMLPEGSDVKTAVFGDRGVIKSAAKGSLLIDCSTIEFKDAQEIGKRAQEAQVRFLDAPVSGGVTGAEAASLTFMVGGDKGLVKEAEPLLLKMGAKVFHCGATGAGQIAKFCNNLILAITMIGTCEGMNLGIKMGLDAKVLSSILNVSTGRSWSSDTYNPVPGIIPTVPSSKGYVGGFAVKLVAKDLGLAQSSATSCNAPIPLGALAHQIYRTLIANGEGDKDFTWVYQFLKGKQ